VGPGTVVALALVAIIEDPARFRRIFRRSVSGADAATLPIRQRGLAGAISTPTGPTALSIAFSSPQMPNQLRGSEGFINRDCSTGCTQVSGPRAAGAVGGGGNAFDDENSKVAAKIDGESLQAATSYMGCAALSTDMGNELNRLIISILNLPSVWWR
jgi:hypothetical protein